MPGLVNQDFVPLLTMSPHGHLVRLRSRTVVDRGLHPQQVGDQAFQPVHGWIFAGHVVADIGFKNHPPHSGRRLRDGVAAQIDDFRRHFNRS